ncbi:RagB/SusD family nutrient uptake outer membrane protein [Arcticibacter tournemirensis]|uniref:RagB/SusD family nutrient uptake outer membrane protein n=2 Tax=Pseudomonadati TaxID=3379134 RepID=A0A4Q0MG03_9SPHI|nr:RagB/SusD family nutrient uptake outer membrane protein [Arcticibacter tournemirensis]RXF72437.1 RagB/SusD family nutrient uptake outer membrane protein [Arcticibacter tournemirensis]
MKRIIILINAAIIFLTIGCEKGFLDRKLDTNYSKEEVFLSYGTMRDFGLGIYTFLPQGFNRIDNAMFASASDEAVHSGTGTFILGLTNGSWGPFSNPDDVWDNMYRGIRKANLFLENSGEYRNVLYRDTVTESGKANYKSQTDDINWLRAEARFLRAFFYFELIKRYGGVPLIKETLDAENTRLPRNTFEECVNFIVTELDATNTSLRDTWSDFNSGNQIGRATRGAALALKARVLLYAASDLNNPGNIRTKWIEAAQAAHSVIALNRYSLASNYRDLFRQMQSAEFIFERRYSASNGLEKTTYPVGYEAASGGVNPSQNLVDAYETSNGLPVKSDPSYNPQKPYDNRDPRLLMSVIVNNSDYKDRKVEIWEGGKDGTGKPRATRTGYYMKKFADESLDLLQNKTSSHAWIYFRYAEILLNYAEAMNEAYGPDDAAGFTLTARQALNMVRKRTGVNMPNVTDVSVSAFRERVRNERRVELAFEEHRAWDVRRWKIAEQELGSPINGVKIIKTGDLFSYQYVQVENRVFTEKMYLYPIQRTEIDKTSGVIKQNPGW